MIGDDFLFNDIWLSDYGMKMYDPESSQQFIGREIEKSGISSLRQIPNHYSAYYANTLTLDFLVIKDNDEFPTQSEKKLSGEDINLIRGWLESPKTPTKLVIPLESDEMTTNYYGVFTDVQPYILNQECYGLYLTFTCNAPYGFSDEYKSTYKINKSNAAINGRFVNLSSEYNDFMKPKIVVKSMDVFGDDESLIIRNNSDEGNYMEFTLPKGKSEIEIDCQKRTIVDENGNLLTMNDIGLTLPNSDEYNFISAEQYIFYWLRFVPNENHLTFIGSKFNTISTIEISGKYIIKSGGF